MLSLGLLVAAFLLCPTEDDFAHYLHRQRGDVAGIFATAAQWLGIHTKDPYQYARDTYHYMGLAAFGRSHEGHLYLGIFGAFLQLPRVRLWYLAFSDHARLPMTPEEELQVLMFVNLLVWFLWCVLGEARMSRHFTASVDNLRRPWTLWSAAVSHSSFFHLLCNMSALFDLGLPLRTTIGRRSFAQLLCCAAVAGNACSLIWNERILGRRVQTLGASGLVNAILACEAALLHDVCEVAGGIPGSSACSVLWFGVALAPLQALAAQLALEVVLRAGSGTDVACHVGGALAGWTFGRQVL